jgi:hypothetical protein
MLIVKGMNNKYGTTDLHQILEAVPLDGEASLAL